MALENHSDGCLYVVATPIGNWGDITLRALEVLKGVDAVICEEERSGSTLLKKLGIIVHELITLNEHNEEAQAVDLMLRLLQKKQQMALISDCGTPVFSDPGQRLIRYLSEAGVKVVPVPGPSSLMAALSILDIQLKQFVFAGFLPRESGARRRELTRLRGLKMPVILMDTPYRLSTLLEEVSNGFGKNHRITLACELTQPGETVFRGSAGEAVHRFQRRKAEFILIVH